MELGATNPQLRRLVFYLRKSWRAHGAKIWLDVAKRLAKPRRRRVAVNVSRINRYTSSGDVVVVPGKVLGAGFLDHPVTVAAFSFTKSAREKVTQVGGRCLSIQELVELNPKGSGVKIIG
ncbi:MAG: 50S ribosomal protein L18e [Candidatus Nezhaarchaeota archaeon]|nr:50S ribosomal protein L18e [Candidatus Nezhaarchaeota archaeon]